MTALLEKAIARTATLPATAQDEVARLMLEALDAQDDQLWDSQFAQSEDVLGPPASEALADYRAGQKRRFSRLQAVENRCVSQ